MIGFINLLAQYREAGVILWRGLSIQEASHQIFGNALGSCKGRQVCYFIYPDMYVNFYSIMNDI